MPAIGEVIAGKYRVDSVVGTGGMGVVLCATHLELGQRVAIKVLTVPEDDARRDEARERFLREGRATAALVSDHVVRVYDVGTLATGAPFMVMELLRGQDLARTLQQRGPLPIELACECVRQAAEAIACAHGQGIVHRDLKPSNLFLTQRSDGSALVKVLDFGISKTTNPELEPLTGNLTATRSVLGTPFYMSPEQVRDAKKVDVRTDIWSLGLILHELLSGSPAFEGTTLPGVCAAIAADPPAALRLKRSEVPVEVEAIVLRCLEKDPARRFQSARDLVLRLAPWTGRAEGGAASNLNDATIRSSPPFELTELAALRDGSTVSLTPPRDTGTLASAVFTQSGERVVGGSAVNHAQLDATRTAPTSPGASAPLASAAKKKTLAFGVGAVASALLVWTLSKPHPTEQASAPPVAPSWEPARTKPAPATAAPRNAEFSVQIDSNPVGAEVYEADTLLGSTPMRISIDTEGVAHAPRTFTVHEAGYAPYTIVQGASDKDVRVLAELVKSPGRESSAATLHVKQPVGQKPATLAPKPSSDIFMQR